jgi:hypothetical protein
MKKMLFGWLLLLVFVFGGTSEASGERYSAAWLWRTSTLKIFSLKYQSTHLGMDLQYFAEDPEGSGGYYGLTSTFPPIGWKHSFWNAGANKLFVPEVDFGLAPSYWLEFTHCPQIDASIFKLTDWCHNNLKFFGVAFNGFDGSFGDWRENLVQTAPFSNIAMVGTGEIISDPAEIARSDSEKVNFAIGLGMKPLVVLSSLLFSAEFENGRLKSVVLKEDYRERLAIYASIVPPEKIWGVYILDEPDWLSINIGMSLRGMADMVNTAIAATKEFFPHVKVLGVMATTKEDMRDGFVFGLPVPANAYEEYCFPNYDWVGFDAYPRSYGSNEEFFYEVWPRYMQNLTDHLHPGQKIFLIPGVYEPVDATIFTKDEYLQQINFYWNVAKSDYRIEAIIPFLWPSIPGMRGLKDFPTEVVEGWKILGRKVKRVVR